MHQCTIFWCLESDHCTERSHPNWCRCSNNTEVSCEGLKCGHSQRCCCRSELKHFSTISYCDIDGIENDDAILLCHWRWVPCYSGWTRAGSYSCKILWVWCWYYRRKRDIQTSLAEALNCSKYSKWHRTRLLYHRYIGLNILLYIGSTLNYGNIKSLHPKYW